MPDLNKSGFNQHKTNLIRISISFSVKKPAKTGIFFAKMVKFLIGKKVGMSQIFEENGAVVPVTVIEIEPNVVTQIKSLEKDGYSAVQIGTGKRNKIKKPQAGHFKELGKFKYVKEFRIDNGGADLKIGDKNDVSAFASGDIVKITGISKGKGFAGAVKRHGFHGMPASHGHRSVQRHVGSIGQRFPQHTLKGMRMAGRMGNAKTTTRGLEVIRVDAENSQIAVRGAVPGNKGGLVIIQSQ